MTNSNTLARHWEMRYAINAYNSEETFRARVVEVATLDQARLMAKMLCLIDFFDFVDGTGKEIEKSKMAIVDKVEPDKNIEVWEYVPGIDPSPKVINLKLQNQGA